MSATNAQETEEKLVAESADVARRLIDEDELNRAPFAERLARSIALTPSTDEATVVALYGAWGCGKTTVKNFTKHFLKANHRIDAIEFSPWEWSGRDRLLDELFLTAGAALRRRKWPWREAKLNFQFHRYAAALGVVSPLIGWVKAWWVPYMAFIGAASLPSAYAVPLAAIGVAVIAVQFWTQGVVGYVAKLAELRRSSLEQIKEDLRAELKKAEVPLVVLIDDLDRLEMKEIRQVIALIKATANLPRIVFVMFCQRDVVARALDEIAGGEGRGSEFLEKIVQLDFQVPEPPSGKLREMLNRGMTRILSDRRFSERWDQKRWNRLCDSSVAMIFRTPRQVARFVSVLRFGFYQHLHGDRLEINPVDVSALEVLRLFEPALYRHMGERNLAAAVQVFRLFDSRKPKRIEAVIESALGFASEERRTMVQSLLIEMLPQLQSGQSFSDAEREEWNRQLRLCDETLYPTYFQLVLPARHVLSVEFERMRSSASESRSAISERLSEHEKRGTLRDVLDRSHMLVPELSRDGHRNLVLALCELGDRLPERRGYGEDDRLKLHAYGLVTDMFRAASSRERLSWLEESLTNRVGLDIPLSMVAGLNREMDGGGIDQEVDVSEAQRLTMLGLLRVRSAAKDGSIWRSDWLGWLLGFWTRQSAAVEIGEWLDREVVTAEKAMLLLLAHVSVSTGATNFYPRLEAETLESRFDLSRLSEILSRASPNSWRERDAVEMLSTALELRKAGKYYKEVKLRDSDP